MSVHLSITHWYSFKTVKHIVKPFSPSGSCTILVFPYQTVWQCSDEDPLMGHRMQGYEKISIFHKYFALSRKRYKIGAIVNNYGSQIGNRTQAFKWYQFE